MYCTTVSILPVTEQKLETVAHTSFRSSETITGDPIPICSIVFTGDELGPSAGGFDGLDRSRESNGDDGVEAGASADRDVPGVIAADIND